MNKLNVKKDDTVVVIAGKDKGQKGKVLVVKPESSRIAVEGVAMVTCHTKPRQQGQVGGRIQKEGTVHVSNVMLVCPHCGKATRVGHIIEGDKKIRVCKKEGCGKALDVKEVKEAKKAKKADKEVKEKKTSKKKTKVEA